MALFFCVFKVCDQRRRGTVRGTAEILLRPSYSQHQKLSFYISL